MKFCVVLLAGSVAVAGAQTPGEPARIEIYRRAVADYIRTGDPSTAAAPLLDWSREQLEEAVKIVIRRADSTELEQAAALHLEVGVATAGLSPAKAPDFLALGSRLIDRLLPPAEIRRGLSAERLAEIATVRATWHVVAASVLLSVNDVVHAPPLAERAVRIAPTMAAALTVAGMVHEIDAAFMNPDGWDPQATKSRQARRRAMLVDAEGSYKRAVDADPSYALARIRLGRVEFLLNDPGRARTSLARGQASARGASQEFLAAMFMGALQQSENDLAGARQSFERALAIAPRSQYAVAALAFLELLSGRPDRAESLAREYTSARLDPGWWVFKTGVLDQDHLEWLRRRVRP
jgi:tetratricopeptide (TPR) repeat protein